MVEEQGRGPETGAGPDGGHGDAVAYVLGALDAGARIRFEAHAAGCAECLRELDELGPVADHLALAVPQVDPPARLKDRVLDKARTTLPAAGARQRPPLPVPPDGGGVAATPLAAAAARQERRTPWWDVSRWGQRVAAPLAVLSLLVALLSAGYAVAEHQELRRTSDSAAQLAETLSIMYQPGRVTRELSPGDGSPTAKGNIYMVPEGLEAVLVAYDLPKLAKREVYQFWLNNPELQRRVSGGTFKVDDRGRGHLVVRSQWAINRFTACGVTREPGDGSPQPTGPRVLFGQL